MSLAPVQPSGWPSAIAPPLTFSRSGSIGSSRRQAMHLRGERLVQLDEIDLVEREPGELQRLADRRAPDRCRSVPARRRPSRRRRTRASGASPSSRARCAVHDQHGRGAVARLRRVAGRDGALRRGTPASACQRLDATCRAAALRRLRAATAGAAGRSRPSNRPASIAATARWWLRSANASCSSREIACFARVVLGDQAGLRYTSG